MAVRQPVGGFKVRLSSLNSDGWRGIALLTACALLLLPEIAGEAGRAALRYDRPLIAAGEWWRLLTAHFVHLSLGHAVLNALGLVLLWALFMRDYRPREWAFILLVSLVAIDVGLWFHDPNLDWYVGASAVLHGVMAAGSWAHLRRGEFDGWLLITFLIGKLAYEQFAGAMPFSTDLGVVVVNAHLYGALGGLAAALYTRRFFKGGA
jgi:rhomboid family GlyGly-CTERM serine protease